MAKHGDIWRSKCGRMELRCGDWREVLADVEPDHVITDPPYSERTEKGVRSGAAPQPHRTQIGMGYNPINESWCVEFAQRWSASGWMFICGDHISWQWHDRAALASGRYTFPPVPIVKRGAAPRMCADGPPSQVEYACVSRPKSGSYVGRWSGLRGFYLMNTVHSGGVRGAKSVETMRAIVRDYSRRGDLVCDPCVGSGTTLLAAAMEGRRAIGSEIDPATFDLAVKRLAAGYTPDLFAGVGEVAK